MSNSRELAVLEQIKAGIDVASRTVYIIGDVDKKLSHRAIVALRYLDATDGDIRIILNSDGGDEDDGYAIYDTITMCRNKVIIDAYGSVMSIAAAIFQAGDVRRMSPNATFMIHHGTTDPIADKDGVVDQDIVLDMVAQLKKNNEKYYRVLQLGSSQPYEIIEEFCRAESFITAKDAVNLCFADEVIKPLKSKWTFKKRKNK